MEQSPRMQLPARASAPLIRPSLPLRVSGVSSRCGEHDGLGGDADTEPMRSCHIGSRRRECHSKTAMTIGFDQPLYVLPFDHRSSFASELFGWNGTLEPEQVARIVAATQVIYE